MLKANCPVLVEHMVHSSISLVGGEAFSLLLKRPWNPAVGMHSMDKQVLWVELSSTVTLLRMVGGYSTSSLREIEILVKQQSRPLKMSSPPYV